MDVTSVKFWLPKFACRARKRDSLFGSRNYRLGGNVLVMVDRALRATGRNAWLRAALLVAGTLLTRDAFAAERPRVAVAIERAAELSLPREVGEGAGGRALAQGVWEACLEPGTLQPRARHVECETLRDVPAAKICIDETVERALTLEIRCDGAGATAEAVDLSRSGCDTAECFAVAAKRAGASDLLVVHAAWKDGLSLTGTLTEVTTGRSRAVTAQDLEKTYNSEWPRSGSQVLALLKWFSRRVTLDVLGDRARNSGAAPSGSATAPVLVAPAQALPPPPPSRARKWIGWTLVGAGAVAGVAAAIVWSKDDDLTGCVAVAGDADPCREVHRTIIPTIALGVGAAAAIVAGTIVLIGGGNSDPKLAVSVNPSGVLVGGRF
jgi:hypothetical protein